jgi:hypothetical protein
MLLKQGSRLNRRYYERFQVEDVINFFSGQLLQAKSPDGAQVFLQSIKITRRPLPSGYRESFRRLQHPNLAPILDVMEEKDQIILVHPPFSGDPLPLIVNKERAMEPEVAVRVVNRCFKTLLDLSRLPLPLSATLDPKNILLNGQKPLLLFYYMKDPEKPRYDEKWRELLFYLLTGQSPIGGHKSAEKILNEKKIPQKIAKLALFALNRQRNFEEVAESIENYLQHHADEAGLSRSRKEKSNRKKVYATVTVAAAALVLVSLAVAQWQPKDSYSSDNPLAGLFVSSGDKANQAKGENQLIQFTKEKDQYTLSKSIQGNSVLKGDFILKETNTFLGYLEAEDKSSIYGLYIDEKGEIGLFHQVGGDKVTTIAKSGNQYRISPNKKYHFEIYYLSGNPVHISLQEEGKKEKWIAVGITPMRGEMKLKFRGDEGARLNAPKVDGISDKSSALRDWLNHQPWIIDFGQAILSVDEQNRNYLDVFPKSQVRLDAGAASGFLIQPPPNESFAMDIQSVGDERFRLVWSDKKDQVELFDVNGNMKKVAEQRMDNYDGKTPLQVAVTTTLNILNIQLTHGSNVTELNHTAENPVLIKDVTLRNTGFKIIEAKK